LFIETSYLKEENLIVVKRRTRDQTKKEVYLVVAFDCKHSVLKFETRRREFLDRKSMLKDIRKLMFEKAEQNGEGSVLDP
jgi:hypothetical protein